MASTATTAQTGTPARGLGRAAAIASLGTSLPARVVGNHTIAQRAAVSEDWIVKRTGIRSRHFLAAGERLNDLAADAARDALRRAGVLPVDVDLVLVATTTADEILPNCAPLVAHALGAERAGAFDVGAACTGFMAALAIGAAQIEAGRAECVLVVGADAMSRITDPHCRQTAPLFADGAGAALLVRAGDVGGWVGPISLGADGGAGAELIRVEREGALIQMEGPETFRHAVTRMAQATLEALRLAELEPDEIDLFVYHQANARILRAVGERLGIPGARVADCIETYANTSAATLPLALAHAWAGGRLRDGDRVLLCAFGAGFTWGAGVIEWSVTE